MERKRYTREFKLEAVKLVKDRGVTVAQAARDLGVHANVLREWIRAFAADPQQAFPGHGQMKPEQLEIAQLKREVTKLKAERDILKKAAVHSTDGRNMMPFMFIRRIRKWRKWAALVCRCNRSRCCGLDGKPANR